MQTTPVQCADFPVFDPEDLLMRMPSGDWINPREITKITIETDPQRYSSGMTKPFVRVNLGINYVVLVYGDSTSYVRAFADQLGAVVNQVTRRKVTQLAADAPTGAEVKD